MLTLQSDYLDTSDKTKKKKKKKHRQDETANVKNFQIIDDDYDISKVTKTEEGEALEELLDPEAGPTIADIIVEKPTANVQKMEMFSNNKWIKVDVCEDAEGNIKLASENKPRNKMDDDEDNDLNFLPRKSRVKADGDEDDLDAVPRRRNRDHDDDGDLNLRRRREDKEDDEGDLSVRRRRRKDDDDEDLDVRRRRREDKADDDQDLDVRRKRPSSDDVDRRSRRREQEEEIRIKKEPDLSPPRNRRHQDEEEDLNPDFRIRRKHKEDQLKNAKNQERLAKYMEWGKGLVQKKQMEERLKTDLHEADKPLARYKDDRDLETLLKERVREDDPMAEYMRRKTYIDDSITVQPKQRYRGPPPAPNRYNIGPGSRWDGVDRSNGFEKKYFESITSKKALQEEAYKWSVEDM